MIAATVETIAAFRARFIEAAYRNRLRDRGD
jgi:hypothetical protein